MIEREMMAKPAGGFCYPISTTADDCDTAKERDGGNENPTGGNGDARGSNHGEAADNAGPVEIELENHRAMIELPENAVEVELRCTVFNNGKLIDVSRVLGFGDIRNAFRKADDGYIDEEDKFVLTEKGRAYVERMLADCGEDE